MYFESYPAFAGVLAIDTPGEIARRLHSAQNSLAEDVNDALGPLDLTGVNAAVLSLIGRGSSTQRSICQQLGLSGCNLTRMLDSLERKALVSRRRSIDDRRVVDVKLTEAGQEAALESTAIVQRVLERHLAGFSASEKEALSVLLGKFSSPGQARLAVAAEDAALGQPKAEPAQRRAVPSSPAGEVCAGDHVDGWLP